MATIPQEYVVCGEHSILFSASGRCPHCHDKGPSGVDYQTAQEVTIVDTEDQE